MPRSTSKGPSQTLRPPSGGKWVWGLDANERCWGRDQTVRTLGPWIRLLVLRHPAPQPLCAHPPGVGTCERAWRALCLGGPGLCVLSAGRVLGVCLAQAHTRSLCQRSVPNTFSFPAILLRLRKPLPQGLPSAPDSRCLLRVTQAGRSASPALPTSRPCPRACRRDRKSVV